MNFPKSQPKYHCKNCDMDFRAHSDDYLIQCPKCKRTVDTATRTPRRMVGGRPDFDDHYEHWWLDWLVLGAAVLAILFAVGLPFYILWEIL
jgi:DNA-directed RNA polymerase subunit RPC12/RpoP